MSNRLLMVVLFAFFVLLIANARAAETTAPVPALKSEVTVTSDVIRLGDLLDHAGAAASTPVFHAPELGMSGTIQTHRIIEAARQNGVPYLDARGRNEVMIVRASRTVTVSELELAVAEAAVSNLGLGSTDDVSIRFDRDVRALQVEPEAAGTPRITRFYYDAHSRRFEGFVELSGSVAIRKHPVRLSGSLVETAEVVTLARSVARSDVIRASDILLERRPRAEIAADALVRPGNVIGQAARRALRAGQALRPADLMKPDLVGRNEAVTIVFEAPGIALTARGRALMSGTEGETVDVMNPHSKRVLQATVTGPGTVTVSRGRTITASTGGAVR